MNLKVDYITEADGWNNGSLKPKGVMVHSTATPGVGAQKFRDRWNRPNVGASIHAFLDDKEVVQCLPWDKKAGHAGGSANNTHIAFEICEPAGFKYSGGATMVGYDVEAQTPYFNAVWNNAVELTAYLCKMYGLDPMADGVVICHSEGYKRGIASNHADVMHWFPKHGKNMDDFRLAVKAAMEKENGNSQDEENNSSGNEGNGDDEEMTYEKFKEYMTQYIEELKNAAPDDWSKDARTWAESAGIILGYDDGRMGYKMPITREEYVVMEHRQIK